MGNASAQAHLFWLYMKLECARHAQETWPETHNGSQTAKDGSMGLPW